MKGNPIIGKIALICLVVQLGQK